MGWESIFAVIFAGSALLWNIFRDKGDDIDKLASRLTKLESYTEHNKVDMERLEKKQGELDDSLQELQSQIHQLDLKVERILAILEKTKGA
ncbi:hypothetical protein H2359_002990 [Salmonella enterica]|nr:hypothetical protein [Salmonella enterica]EAZ5519986.1 hypothetical protein [Salmonella enterica]EBB1669505.1 hypothetical protein [Salmonella enterica]EBE1722278.1 hypothetical protein [Salmonella enterica]EBO5870859.1 hypothetical protein [Salmonella enterica]